MNRLPSASRFLPAVVALLLGAAGPAAAEERSFRLTGGGWVDQAERAWFASGEATHLGRWVFFEEVRFDHPVTSGLLEFNAANGDYLFAAFEGAFIDTHVFVADLIFVGGTGRFADATGTANLIVVFDADPLVNPFACLTLTIDGTVDY